MFMQDSKAQQDQFMKSVSDQVYGGAKQKTPFTYGSLQQSGRTIEDFGEEDIKADPTYSSLWPPLSARTGQRGQYEDEEEEVSSDEYVTSDTDDENVDEERYEHRQEKRSQRRQKRKLLSEWSGFRTKADYKEWKRKTGKGNEVKLKNPKPATLRRSTRQIPNDQYCDYLEQLAEDCFRANPKAYGNCPLVGFGDGTKLVLNNDTPTIGLDVTGPQFDMWVRKWRYNVERNANNVHPLLMGDFLRSQLENACTDDLWLWVKSTLKDATAGDIMKGLRERVFSKFNMAGTFLDIVQRPQEVGQMEDQLIAENDSTIAHFHHAYPNTHDGMGIFLLMARLRNQKIHEKVSQMQDKSYKDICKVVIEFGQTLRQSAQLHNRVTGKAVNETQVKNAETTETYKDEQGCIWYLGSQRGRAPWRGGNQRGRGNFRGRGGQRGNQRGGYQGYRSRSKSHNRSWSRSSSSERLCRWCGGFELHTRHDQCPAFGKECLKCRKMGHFVKAFRTVGQQGSSSRSNSEERGRSQSPRRGPNSSKSNQVESNATYLEQVSLMVEATQQTQIKTLEDPFEKKMIEVFGPLLNPPTCQGTPRVKADIRNTGFTSHRTSERMESGQHCPTTSEDLNYTGKYLRIPGRSGCIARFRGKHQCHARINRQKIWSDKV